LFIPFRFLRFHRRTLPLRCNQLKIKQERKSCEFRKQFVKGDARTKPAKRDVISESASQVVAI